MSFISNLVPADRQAFGEHGDSGALALVSG